jgi:hypothetical protein
LRAPVDRICYGMQRHVLAYELRPWAPVIPVEVVPSLTGGDRKALVRLKTAAEG